MRIPKIMWLAFGLEVYYLAVAFGPYEVVSGLDTLVRYAPMAEAFASGDFVAAFHPRFCMLFQILSGSVVWVTGLDGIRACQLVAITGWIASGVVLWYFCRRVFDEAAAWWSTLLLLVGSEFFHYGCEGYRDDLRILFVLMMCVAFDRLLFPRSGERLWVGSLIMAVSTLGLSLLRIDCLPMCVVGLLAYFAICLYRKVPRLVIMPCACFVVAVVSLCAMTYSYTDYFVPSVHYVKFFAGGAT